MNNRFIYIDTEDSSLKHKTLDGSDVGLDTTEYSKNLDNTITDVDKLAKAVDGLELGSLQTNGRVAKLYRFDFDVTEQQFNDGIEITRADLGFDNTVDLRNIEMMWQVTYSEFDYFLTVTGTIRKLSDKFVIQPQGTGLCYINILVMKSSFTEAGFTAGDVALLQDNLIVLLGQGNIQSAIEIIDTMLHSHSNKALLDEYNPADFAEVIHTHVSNDITVIGSEPYEGLVLTGVLTEIGDTFANQKDHNNDADIHITSVERTTWNNKADNNHNHTLASLSEKSYNSLTDKPSSFTPSAHTHVKADITDFNHNHNDLYNTKAEITSFLANKENAFTKNTAFNKNFGTTSGTVCQGNDSRLSDSRTPLAHNHTSNDVVVVNTENYNDQPLSLVLDDIDARFYDFKSHTNDTDIHVTTEDKSNWDSKADGNHNHNLAELTEKDYSSLDNKPDLSVYATNTALSNHSADSDLHLSSEEKTVIEELINNPITINNFITNVHDLRNILSQNINGFDVFFNRNLAELVINNMPSFYYRIRVQGSIHSRGGANSAGYDFENNPLYIHIFDRDTESIIKTYSYDYIRTDHKILFDNTYLHLDTESYLNLGVMLSDKADLSGTYFEVVGNEIDFQVNIVVDRIAKRAYHKEIELSPNTVTLTNNEHIITLPDGAELLFNGYYHLDAYFETEEIHSGSPSFTAIPLLLQCREYNTSEWKPLDKSVFSGLSNGVYVRSLQGSRILNLANSKKLQIRLYCPNDTEMKYSGYVHLHYLTDYNSNEVM